MRAMAFMSPRPAEAAIADILRVSIAAALESPALDMKNIACASACGVWPKAGPRRSISSFHLTRVSFPVLLSPSMRAIADSNVAKARSERPAAALSAAIAAAPAMRALLATPIGPES